MSSPTASSNESLIQCSICRKEVPKSAALTPEGSEYVEHFCGADCYDQYFAEHPEKSRSAADKQGKS